MGSSKPFLDYDKLSALSTSGGYSRSVRLSEMASVFLLSAIVVVRQKWMWQKVLYPISKQKFTDINEMLDQVSFEIMRNSVGEIVPTIAQQTDTNLLFLDGSSVPQIDYPQLADVVPLSWLVDLNIVLPDLTSKGLFGAINSIDVGNDIGENYHTLSVDEMPSHTHTQNSHSHLYNNPIVTPTGAGPIVAGASVVIPAPTTTTTSTAVNQNTGGNEAHNNIQSSLRVYFYIVAR